MSLNIFYIKFDQLDAVYVPGGIISGCVVIDLTRKKIIEALTLTAKGETNIKWLDTMFIPRGNEKYFDLTIPLLKRTEGNGRIHLPAGVSRYPFCIKLPRNIPCSFEHCNGYIRYTIKANIIKSWRLNSECEAAFTVIAAYDLNIRREQCIAICDEVNRAYSFLCCISNSWINMHIKLATRGFVPGQWIVAIFNLRDTSNINLQKICVKLHQFSEFRATTSIQYVKTTVAAVQKIGPFEDATFALRLYIPSVPPSELEFCNIIRLKYVLRIILHNSKIFRKIVRQYPILIGTIPLRPALSASAVSSSPHVSQSTSKIRDVPITPESAIALNVPCPDSTSTIEFLDPPPSYEECYVSRQITSFSNQDLLFVLGSLNPFVPKYPVFKFPISYPP